jgi:hypothetical protein
VTVNPSGRRGQASRSVSLGASDPRARRAPQEALTDLDLESPLKINRSGQISLDLSGALTVNPDGSIGINVSNGITVAPGSPLSIQLDIDDDSLVIGPNKKVRARPRMSQIVVDRRDVREVTGRNLAEVIDQETELLKRKGAADGYCELDSSSKVPVARVPFDLIPLSIKLSSINDPTYNHIILRFDDSGTSAAVNYLGVVNSDAGLPVIFKSDGADADVGIEITTKGLGVLTVNGSAVEFAANKNIAGGYAGLDGSSKVSPAQLPLFTSIADGAVSASGGGTTNFLRADGSWAAPGGGGGGGLSQANALAIASFGSF